MGRYRARTTEPNEDRWLIRARNAFITMVGVERAAERQRQINALPSVEWKGRTLRTVTCHAQFGRGPHVQNVPERILWALIDVRAYRCPFHF